MSVKELWRSHPIVLQASLLRMITPNVRGVTCEIDEHKISLKFVCEGAYSEEEGEECDDVATEVIAHFSYHLIDLQVVSTDINDSIDKLALGDWAYLRKE